MMPEKIYMTYTNATAMPYAGWTFGHHIVLNYIDAEGNHHTLQGVPEHPFRHNLGKLGAFSQEEGFSDGTNNTDSRLGRLQAIEKDVVSDSPLNQPYTMVAEGDDLSPQWALMRGFADEVNSTGYEYRPYSQNSNSFAGGALQRADLMGSGSSVPERFNQQPAFDPVSGETSSRYVPGFETTLKNPIDTESPLPFPLDVRARAPGGSNAAPDRRGFLDDGPRNPDFAASNGPGVPDDTPVRYLGRTTYSLSQAPDATAAAYGIAPPTIPKLPSDDAPLTLMQAYLLYRKRLDANQSS
jgi:hypothetical protein